MEMKSVEICRSRIQRDRLFVEQCLDIVEMPIAVKGAVHAELGLGGRGVFLHLFHHFGRECLEFSIYSFGRGQAKLRGSARVQGVTNYSEGVVYRCRIDGRRVKA